MRTKQKDGTGKSNTFGTVSAITTDTGREETQNAEATQGLENQAAGESSESRGPVNMMNLMRKVERIDKSPI